MKDTVTIKWKKIIDKAKIPTKRNEDAGFDLYTTDGPLIILKPHQTKMFNTGLMSMFDQNLVGIIKERGSTGSIGLSVRSGVIDSGYRGEWKITLTNLNTYPIEFDINADKVITYYSKFNKNKIVKVIYPLKKAIAQVVFFPLPNYELKQLTEKDLSADESVRKDSGWGASGK